MSETQNNQTFEEFNFVEELEKSFKSIYNGEKVTATVIAVTPTELQVDVGAKQAGFIPLTELSNDPALASTTAYKPGDKVDVMVTRVNDVDGTVTLSKKRLDAIAGFDKIAAACESKEIVTGAVTDIVKGGVIAVSNGVRVFIPASRATLRKDEPLEELKGKEVSFRVLEVNPHHRRVIGSIRDVLLEQRKELEEKVWSGLEVGQTHTGVVKTLMPFGAFVDIGGVDGLIHISELSWSKINHPSEVVHVGDTVEVTIKDLDLEKRKISLSYKQSKDNPWTVIAAQYPVGSVAKVKIVGLTAFGAFAQILPGVDGLIHISQIALDHVKHPKDILSIGEDVEAKITAIDFEKRKISLSMKALLTPSEPTAKEFYEREPSVAGAPEEDLAPPISGETAKPSEEPAETDALAEAAPPQTAEEPGGPLAEDVVLPAEEPSATQAAPSPEEAPSSQPEDKTDA